MRVLDLDLDFFLDHIAHDRGEGERLSSEEYHPWNVESVIAFLEDRCGLGRQKRVRGRVITDHVEAFYYWRGLIQGNELTVPFDVIHVDAHADLGMGDGGWAYLVSDVARRELPGRATDLREGHDALNSGNFLAFALGCRWISNLTYVYHHTRVPHGGPNDLFAYHFKDLDATTNTLQLKRTDDPFLLNERNEFQANVERGLIELEPEIPFEAVSPQDFRDDGDFDLVVLCRSPGFTPRESDLLIPVISRYIQSDASS